MRSLESLSRSRNMDVPRDPEGIYSHNDKHDDEPLSFEEHLREVRKLKDSIGDLPTDTSAETIKQNEETLNGSRHLYSIEDFAKQDVTDGRASEVLRKMDDVASFGKQYRNLADKERTEKIENAREKVLESFKKSFDNNDSGSSDHNKIDDSKINHYPPVVDEKDKPQMDPIPVTDFFKVEPINMPSLELEEPVSSINRASPEEEAIFHELQMEQILGQFFPKTEKHETSTEHREASVADRNLIGGSATREALAADLSSNEKKINDNYPEKEQEQIEQLKVQLSNCDNQIEKLISNMQPYMQIPKVSREISKVIEKNNEINLSQTTDSINSYKIIIEAKQSLIAYLEQANKFISDNIEKQQVAQLQTPAQQQADGFPERIYNDDGTYTTEYINYTTNTPSGLNQEYRDRLIQENEFERKKNQDPTSLLSDSSVWGWVNDGE